MRRLRIHIALKPAAVIFCAAAQLGAFGIALAAGEHLLETGSTLLYPVMTTWMGAYQETHAGVEMGSRATGSGAGIADAIAGDAQIGGSDAYLSDAQLSEHVVDIPLAISAQDVLYNVPELHGAAPLRLSGPVLAAIYSGAIANWNDSRIASINPGTKLPNHVIVPIHRADGSGDTSLFTQYLSLTTPSWDGTIHWGTHVDWPPNHAASETIGNAGMIELAQYTPYSLAYAGISYRNRAQASGLDAALLQNRAGAFVGANDLTMQAALDAAPPDVPADARLSLVNMPGRDSYPIVNIEYAVVRTVQASAGAAATLKDFLGWVVSPAGGNDRKFLGPVNFQPLPPRIRAVALRQIDTITGP